MSPVELILVRHGLPNRVEGVVRPDPDLTAAGLAQAGAVAEVPAPLFLRAIAGSGLQKALQTGHPTAEIDADLAELTSAAISTYRSRS